MTKNKEQELRMALAFILEQRSMDSGARSVAFNTLKSLYGDAIVGDDLKEHDRIVDEQIVLANQILDELIAEEKKKRTK